jgi:hypothetical protein
MIALASCGARTMLRITSQSAADRLTLKLEGNLTGIWVTELENAWRASEPILAGRRFCLDLTCVNHMDQAGEYLLALLHWNGAQLTASGMMMAERLQTITGEWPCHPSHKPSKS